MNETAVIIANWNGQKFLKDCLDSLRGQTYKNFKIILVDNGSEDDSVFFVEKNYSEVEMIKLPENTGFAHANNLGMKKAFESSSIKYIVTLNNDTKADPAYLENLTACAKRHPEAGSIQPKVLSFYKKNRIDSVGILIYLDASAINRGQNEMDGERYEKEEEIFGASASAALYSREALEKTELPNENYFDKDYFAYYEDVDLAWRMRLSGFKSFYCPQAIVHHIHSATGKSYSPFKSFHIHRNQYYNIIKNLPFFAMVKALAFMPIRYFLLLLSILKKSGPAHKLSRNKKGDSIVKVIFGGVFEVAKNLPTLIAKRRLIQGKKTVKNREIKTWMNVYRADLRKMIFS